MNGLAHRARKWTERPSASGAAILESQSMFRLLFERSADAIWLFDPEAGVFVDCNQAAVELMRAGTKSRLLQTHPADLSPPFQPDGRASAEKAAEITQLTAARPNYRFEWVARRLDGQEVPLEVSATPISANGRALHVVVSRDITERKQTENELRESQQLLASVADNISEAIYRTGPNHELIFANRAYLRLSGYKSLAELRHVPREQLYANPADRARLLQLLATEGSFRNQEIEYIRRDGRHWWGLSNSLAIRDPESGKVLYHVGSVSDVTERKQAQEELLRLNSSLEKRVAGRTAELTASEARLRTLVEHAPEAIVVFDGDTGRFLSSNAPACRLYGYPAEELTRLTPAEVSPELQPGGRRSAELAREWMNRALAGEAPVFEWIHRHASGRLIATEVRLVRLPAEGQNLLRASIIDNTERNRREKIQQATFKISEAAHQTEDLDSFYRQIHEIVGGLMAAENFYIALLDPTSETFSFPYFVDERDAQPAPMKLSQGLTGYVLRTGKPLLASDENIARATGTGVAVVAEGCRAVAYAEVGARAAVWLGVPLSLPGKRIGVMALQDYRNPQAYGEAEKQILLFVAAQTAQAVERKRAEAELLKSLAREKELSQLKSNFVSMVSHEFRTPLGVIMSSAEILESYLDELGPAERREQLQSIRKNSRRMANLMEEVLLLGMAEAGKLDFKPAELALGPFCRRLVDELQSATNHKCPVTIAIPPDAVPAFGDERLLQHIFTNLLSNAVKYSAQGSAVDFAIEREGRDAVCRIRDRGLGIPKSDLARMFKAFQRGRNVRQVPGTGLGLAIVERCVELHGGNIGIESAVGRGTTVTLRLPLFKPTP
jgi:PAS domain S-box-containing protein